MFDVRAIVLEVEVEENLKTEGNPRAKVANCANNDRKVSTFSTLSTPPPPENGNIQKSKGIHENADYHAKRIALEWLDLIQETNPDNIAHVINVAITHPESLKFMERRINQLPSQNTKTTSEVNCHE